MKSKVKSKRDKTDVAPVTWGPVWGKGVGQVLARVVYATQVLGGVLVPRRGAVIFAGNHVGYLDGPIMYGVAPRRMHVMVKKEMFVGFLGKVLHLAGSLSVDRQGDRQALLNALALLRDGRCVGILPEGTRGAGAAESIAGGIAWLALRSGAPIVPVAILGTRVGQESVDVVPRPRRPIRVVFGEPFSVSAAEGVRGRAAMDAATRTVQMRLAEHVQDSVRRTGFHLPEAQGS